MTQIRQLFAIAIWFGISLVMGSHIGIGRAEIWSDRSFPPTVTPTVNDDDELPTTKPGTLIVEGEPVEVTLNLYADADMPLITYYPESLAVDDGCGDIGCGIFFRSTGAYTAEVNFFFPSGELAIADLEAEVTSDQGMIANQGWIIDGIETDPASLSFPWAKTLVRFHEPNYELVGAVYIGEANGRVFRVTVVMLPEAGDGFSPIAHSILEHVQVRPRPAF